MGTGTASLQSGVVLRFTFTLPPERRWPRFRQQAAAAGLRAWLSVLVRQHQGPIGALDLARTDPQPWQPQDVATSEAFARLIMATLELARAGQQEGLAEGRPLRAIAERSSPMSDADTVLLLG